MIYIVENCTINLVWHILHRWLEIVIPPVAFIWFLRNLKPRNYITILINTKSLKIFWLFMWTQHVFTFWLIIHTVMHVLNIIINTVEIILKYALSKCTTLNPHLSAMFMISIPILCRGIARLNLILGHTFKTVYSSVTTGMLVHSYVRLLTVVVWKVHNMNSYS